MALPQVARLLGQLDRETHSATGGSFDREHWGWKFRDFPIGVMQMGIYPLALLWRHRFPGSAYYQNERLLQWITLAIRHTVRRQRGNGAFDAFSPNDFDPGPTLGVVYALAKGSAVLGDALPNEMRLAVERSARHGANFALRHEQTHGFVSNHWALFACAFQETAEMTGDARYETRAREIVRRIVAMQSADGWYQEYGGPDPGYETLGISYLAKYWQRTRDAELLASLKRALGFLSYCVHPDGSVGGVYGSRHDALYFPAGCALLADALPEAAAIARFMRSRLGRGNVVTPETVDAHNLVPLMASYLEAARAEHALGAAPLLPCEGAPNEHHFSEAGITAVASARYYAVVNAQKGGVIRVFDREQEALLYEDAGYVVQAGKRRWISQTLGLGRVMRRTAAHIEIETTFARYHQPVPTPYNYLVLRLLAITLFRSARLGAWIRDRIVGRLIARVDRGPLTLRRTIAFDEDAVRVTDALTVARPMTVDRVVLARSLTGIHMGSAKYFHPSELLGSSDVALDGVRKALSSAGKATASYEFSVEVRTPAPLPVGETASATLLPNARV